MKNDAPNRQQLLTEAGRLFTAEKPEHFTDYRHCCECAEHDETLRNTDIKQIGLAELGNPGWDPLCFCSADGMKYYLPALVRLSLDTVNEDFYFAQLLFHLEYAGAENRLINSCSSMQRRFIADFLKFMIEQHPEQIEENFCSDEALRAYQLWSDS